MKQYENVQTGWHGHRATVTTDCRRIIDGDIVRLSYVVILIIIVVVIVFVVITNTSSLLIINVKDLPFYNNMYWPIVQLYDTSKTAKINFNHLVVVEIMPTSYHVHGP